MPEFEKLQLFVVKHMLKASLLQVRIPIWKGEANDWFAPEKTPKPISRSVIE